MHTFLITPKLICIIIHSKYFPNSDWLKAHSHVIHHNQLLMTKFGRILCLKRKWRQKCSPLQVKAPLTKKTWLRGWVVGGHFARFKTWQKQPEDNSEGDICYLEIFAELDKPKGTPSKMNLTSIQVSMF